MAETTGNDDLAAAVRDRGMQQLEGAKGQLAEGAERVAAAVDRTAEQLEGDGDNAISGFGHSVASLMRQLAGGLRERDVEEFARELAALARRNPGVFLAGSVALGFGIARFFKAHAPSSSDMRGDGAWQSAAGGWSTGGDREHDAEERLDLSASSTQRRGAAQAGVSQAGASQTSGAPQSGGSSYGSNASPRDDEHERNASKSRQSTKHKAKPQRASTGGAQHQSSSTEPSTTDSAATSGTADSNDSAFTGGTGGGALRGGKS